MMGAHVPAWPFMHQVLEACPSPPYPRVLLLHSLGHWLELCSDLERHPIERADPKFWLQHLLHP